MSLTLVSVPSEAKLPDIVVHLLGLVAGAALAPSPAEALAPPGPVVMLIDPPEVEVAGFVTAGHGLTQAIGAWAARTEALLGLLRRHRRRVLIVSSVAARSHPQAFLRAIAARFAAEVPLPAELPPGFAAETRYRPAEPLDPVLMLAVTGALAVDRRSAPLAREIEAMLTELADDMSDPDLSLLRLAERAILHNDALCRDLAASQGNAAENRAENRLLSEQLRSMRADMEYLIRAQDAPRGIGDRP